MKFLDRAVAGLGALLAVCVVVSVGARLVRDNVALILVLLGLAYVYRLLWRGR